MQDWKALQTRHASHGSDPLREARDCAFCRADLLAMGSGHGPHHEAARAAPPTTIALDPLKMPLQHFLPPGGDSGSDSGLAHMQGFHMELEFSRNTSAGSGVPDGSGNKHASAKAGHHDRNRHDGEGSDAPGAAVRSQTSVCLLRHSQRVFTGGSLGDSSSVVRFLWAGLLFLPLRLVHGLLSIRV